LANIKRIGVLTGGGDCPGLNAVIRAVAKTANKLVADIEELTKLDARATVLGHVQRGGSPSPADRVLATQFGHHALEILMKGAQGQLVVQQHGRLGEVPIQSVAGKQRMVTLDNPLLATARAVGTCFGD
jgi:6-phosphofructokinase